MVSAITAEHATEGFTAMKLAISSAVAARNNYDNHKGQLYTEAVDADSESLVV